jgi:hypothetical protein
MGGATGGAYGTPAYFNRTIYMHGQQDVLKAFTWNGTTLAASGQGATTSAFPGTTPTISANGTSNAIVWELQVDGYNSHGPAILRALDASNIGNELYNSGTRAGLAVKFTVPTVANGKVYVGTQSELDVFGRIK